MTDLVFEPLDVDDGIVWEPQDWQLSDIEKIVQKEQTYSADWSEMGCFKTSTGLWLLDQRAKQYREQNDGKTPISLIITSSMGKGPYYDTLPKVRINHSLYIVGMSNVYQKIAELKIPTKMTDIKREGDHVIFLAHYEVFTPRKGKDEKQRLGLTAKYLMQLEWTNILVDEAHRIKNPDTKWTRQIKRLKGLHKHIMTGTGFVNRPDELWSLLHFLNKKQWPSYWAFREEYCDEYFDERSGMRTILGIKEEKLEEFISIQKNLGARHFMAEVHPNIGSPIEKTETVQLGSVQRTMFEEIKNELYTLDQKGEPITSPNVLSALNRMRQISVATPQVTRRYYDEENERMKVEIELVEPSSKLDKVMELLDEIRWDDEVKRPVVIFSSFKDPLKLLEERFKEAEIPYIHLQASHSEQERYRLWHDEFPKGEHRVFMSTLQLGGESINLTPAQYLIFLDRDWSPKNMMQAVGRVYRPGQENVPEIIYINAVNSIDQRISNLLSVKGKWFNAVFGPEQKDEDDGIQ